MTCRPSNTSVLHWGFRLLLGALAFLMAGPLPAQSSIGEMRRQATREELEKAVKAAETASLGADEKTRAKLRSDAEAIRNRLANGDFVPGDRILLLVEGDTALSDTFTVRGDRMLPLPNIPDLSLHGVLDSELEPHLTKELQKYIRSVSLTATPLVRISLLGFPQGNFFTVPVDRAITDVISAAGGWGSPTQVVPEKAVVRRAGRVVLDAKATAEAIRLGKTVGDMALRDGDELYVPDRASGFSWGRVLTSATALFGAVYWIFLR